MKATTNELAILASKAMLTPKQAVALPTAITVAAGKLEMSESAFAQQLLINAPLLSYVAQICREVVK